MHHPNLPNLPIEVPTSAVPTHEHSGWEITEPPTVERPEDVALAELEGDKPSDTESASSNDESDSLTEEPDEPTAEQTDAKRVRRANSPKERDK